MGEGRRDRTSKRRRSLLKGAQKSCSDSEVAQSRLKDRRTKSRDLLPWPKPLETLTVDELSRYRRRRVHDGPKDNFESYGKNEAYENLVTEYRRAFRATSEDSLLRENSFQNAAEFVDGSGEDRTDGRLMETDVETSKASAETSKPVPIRRGMNFKREDYFYGKTESSNYKFYEGIHRPELARRSTSLKIEGDMRTVTEQCEKFIEWFNVKRPEAVRNKTNLKMEGRLETSTENHDQYVPFVGARRPELLRQGTNLRLEGEPCFLPEYTDVFRPHAFQEKRTPKLPETHLKMGGDFSGTTENCQNFLDPRGTVPINKSHDNNFNADHRQMSNEGDMKMLVSKLEEMNGPSLEIPEYKDSYKDFPRERPKLLKPEDEIGRADGTKIHQSPNPGKFQIKIDQDPEYKSKYVNKDRPVYRKPPISSRLAIGSSGFGKRIVPDLRQYEPTSEVRSQYIPYGQVPRVESLRMAANLRPEGSMDLQPEYRDAYCTKREHPVMADHRDRSLSGLRRRENNWINNNNGEQFGLVNAEHDQEAFQVLQTRVHNESIVGKPPIMTRRGSRASQFQKPTHLDTVNSSVSKNRSPSPTYRLHVCNVDDQPRGFNRRRRSSFRQKSPSPEQDMSNSRTYSPSFGRSHTTKQKDDDDQHAFVVLDNNQSADSGPLRHDRNSNVEMGSVAAIGRTRNKTPANWMPPWYDNTSTI